MIKVSQACEVTGSESNVTHKIIANKILANKDEILQEKWVIVNPILLFAFQIKLYSLFPLFPFPFSYLCTIFSFSVSVYSHDETKINNSQLKKRAIRFTLRPFQLCQLSFIVKFLKYYFFIFPSFPHFSFFVFCCCCC